MTLRHEPNASQFQIFSAYGPFKQAHQQQAIQESVQMQTYHCDTEDAPSTNSAQRQATATPIAQVAQSSEYQCNCKELCYYVQRLVFGTAFMVGLALVIVGAIQISQTGKGEHDVFLYIGVLLMAVGSVLCILQWDVHRKERRRRLRNLTVTTVPVKVEDLAMQTHTEPLLEDNSNRIIVQTAGANSYPHQTDTSPSEFRSIISQPYQASLRREQYPHHHHHHHRYHPKSHSSHQIPRYDIYSSQVLSGSHDLAHSIPLQDKV